MKYSEIQGMPVVSVQGADELGHVDDLYLDLGQSRILALRVNLSGLFSGHRALQWKDIQSIGQNAVTVASSSVLQQARDLPALENAVGWQSVRGMKVMTEGGDEVGTVSDLDLDPATGHIESYLLQEGFLDRLQHKERLIPSSAVVSTSSHMLVVNSQALTNIPSA